MGTETLEKQLKDKGFDIKQYPNSFIGFMYKIPHGRFKGRDVEIALQAPQFPEIPPSGIHVKPHLLPIKTDGQNHPFDGIHARNLPTAEFQYWSRPFKGWDNSLKNIDEYLAFIRTLFDFE